MLIAALSGLFGRNEKYSAEELALLAQQGDTNALNNLLHSYAPFMKKAASQVCKRYIDDHDDEFSIAMSAFHEAVKSYEKGKNASFLTFAHMIIRRRIIDFIRKESQRNEFSHPFNSVIEEEEGNGWIEDSEAIKSFTIEQQTVMRREEIAIYEEMLSSFDLSFETLVKVSPGHEDSRKSCMQIALLVAETDEYLQYLMEKKKLPIKDIEKMVDVSRKTIERNRKFIIAVALLINSELHYLKDYLKERLI
ncbi:RNA polymerase sigma-I factor [Planococcus chinensis]|uniref:RNA polymerase sigma factor SigI n=1 Tax=Planococcus chinensis TaxID=272917 RepID=A0ABW4QFG0_9BACL